MVLFFLSSGLFLGWSLGANDAANVFGSAVGSRMVKFKQAAIIAGVFVILGAVIQGSGASHTLGKLGAVDAIAVSFTVALCAALTVFWITRLRVPVSTSQAIVGAIIGWNLYTGNTTDPAALVKITSAILNNENRILPVSVYNNGVYAIEKDVYIGLPAVINKEGIHHPVKLKLSTDELIKLNKSADMLRGHLNDMEI